MLYGFAWYTNSSIVIIFSQAEATTERPAAAFGSWQAADLLFPEPHTVAAMSDAESTDIENDFEACEVCNKTTDAQKMLLCDGCDKGFHTFCIGLKHIPKEAWFCTECK